ncbi:uncharacterized protein LOC111455861 isoform X1 [Cucurbita moschata]|uniref:Uncharacterized protein LOC111455861 isoform X1 n=1 Tax=Cucurbita moschata TaxID=3662 RepID=A0A6J1GP43_CUCMO|nr:uncharacterized protein LOC111455861 isoform X1 [Cucurbita moschata]
MASFGSLKNAIFEREERKQQYQAHVRGLNAHDRRKKFMHAQRSFITRERKKMRNSEGWSKKCPKGRGKKASTSSGDHKADDKNDFDEYGPQGYTSGLHRQYFQVFASLKPFRRRQMAIYILNIKHHVHVVDSLIV